MLFYMNGVSTCLGTKNLIFFFNFCNTNFFANAMLSITDNFLITADLPESVKHTSCIR